MILCRSTPALVEALLREFPNESPNSLLAIHDWCIEQAELCTSDVERASYLERAVNLSRAAVQLATSLAIRGAA